VAPRDAAKSCTCQLLQALRDNGMSWARPARSQSRRSCTITPARKWALQPSACAGPPLMRSGICSRRCGPPGLPCPRQPV